MDKNTDDEIVINAILKRFTEIRLPRALEIEKHVLAGGTISESDITFLDTVLKDAQYVLRYSDKYPEYRDLVSQAIDMYTSITQKALENEKKGPKA